MKAAVKTIMYIFGCVNLQRVVMMMPYVINYNWIYLYINIYFTCMYT